MEYYDEIQELLNAINDDKNPHTKEIEELTGYFNRESGKEIYLMFSEWLSFRQSIEYEIFMRLLPLIHILFDHLKKASPLISQDFIELLYNIINFSYYNPDQMHNIELFLTDPKNDLPEVVAYNIFVSLYITNFTKELADRILPYFMKNDNDKDQNGTIETVVTEPIAKKFFSLPVTYKLSFARCAVIYPEKFKCLSLEQLSKLLLNSYTSPLQNDGVKLLSSAGSLSNPREIFVTVVRIGPFLSTAEAAQNAWRKAISLISNLSDEERFFSYQAALENPEKSSNDQFASSSCGLCDASLSAITHQLEREISAAKNGGIFRSPMVSTNLLPLVLDPSVLASPAGKTEVLLTILNFVYLLLLIDKKKHCFRLFESSDMINNLQKRINQVKSALKTAKKENEKPKEKILQNLKKMNLGQDMSMSNVDEIIQTTNIAINRVQFTINEIQNLIDGK